MGRCDMPALLFLPVVPLRSPAQDAASNVWPFIISAYSHTSRPSTSASVLACFSARPYLSRCGCLLVPLHGQVFPSLPACSARLACVFVTLQSFRECAKGSPRPSISLPLPLPLPLPLRYCRRLPLLPAPSLPPPKGTPLAARVGVCPRRNKYLGQGTCQVFSCLSALSICAPPEIRRINSSTSTASSFVLRPPPHLCSHLSSLA